MLGWFRRHATILMVVLGSGAMAIFGLGPVFDSWARGTGGGGGSAAYENKTLATWQGGKITRDDIQRMKEKHYSAQRFLSELMLESEKRTDNYRPLAPVLPRINDDDEANVDSQLLERMMYAEKARQEGFLASDALVDNYLGLLSADAGFTQKDLDIINRRVNQRVPLIVIKEHLKTELLYAQMLDFLYDRFQTSPPNPTEAMELYHRTSDQIELLVFPVSVESKLAQVKDKPSAAEMKALWEEGKLLYADPASEKPGFKIGRKANVQYFLASFDKFLEKEMNTVTDEEVQKEYDRLVKEKSFLVMEPIMDDNSFQVPDATTGDPTEGGDAPDDVEAPPMEDGAPTLEEPKTEAPKTEAPKTEAPKTEAPKTEASKTEAPKAEAPKTEAPKTEAPKTEEAKKGAEEAKAEAAKTEEAKKEAPKKEEAKSDEPPKTESGDGDEESGDSQSQTIRDSKFQFVSTRIQDTDPGKTEGSTEATPATTPPVQDADAAPAAQETGDAGALPAVPPTQETGEADAGALPAGLQIQDEDDKPKQKVKPLKDVIGDVKRQMSIQKAQDKMSDAIEKANSEVQNYFMSRLQFEQDPQPGDTMPDFSFKAVAEQYGLEARESGLVDVLEFRKDQLGAVPLPQTGTVADAIFAGYDRKDEFDSQPFGGIFPINDQYLFWFAEKTDARIPELEECKDEIIEYWRQKKAVELAKQEAESIKKKVNAAGSKKMSEMFGENSLETGAFTWFNTSFGGAISQPTNVENAGDEFMETAFSLAEMEAGVAVNADKSIVYVLQSLTGTRPVSEFGSDYLTNQYMRFQQIPQNVSQAADYYHRNSQRELAEGLRDELKFKRID